MCVLKNESPGWHPYAAVSQPGAYHTFELLDVWEK